MKVHINIETDSIDEGRRMLRGLEALLNSGAVVQATTVPTVLGADWAALKAEQAVERAREYQASPQAAADAAMATPAGTGPQPDVAAAPAEAPKRTRRTKEQIAADEAAAKAKAEAAAAPATGPVPAPSEPEAEAEPTQEAEEPVTHEALRKLMNRLAGIIGVQPALAELERIGHKKIAQIPEEKLASVGLLLTSAIGKAEAAQAKAAA